MVMPNMYEADASWFSNHSTMRRMSTALDKQPDVTHSMPHKNAGINQEPHAL